MPTGGQYNQNIIPKYAASEVTIAIGASASVFENTPANDAATILLAFATGNPGVEGVSFVPRRKNQDAIVGFDYDLAGSPGLDKMVPLYLRIDFPDDMEFVFINNSAVIVTIPYRFIVYEVDKRARVQLEQTWPSVVFPDPQNVNGVKPVFGLPRPMIAPMRSPSG